MNSVMMIVLRFYNLTLGRVSAGALMLKRFMIYVLIWKAKKRYVASTKYFDYRAFFKDSRANLK